VAQRITSPIWLMVKELLSPRSLFWSRGQLAMRKVLLSSSKTIWFVNNRVNDHKRFRWFYIHDSNRLAIEHSLFFTNNAFLHFPQRIEYLAEDNDRSPPPLCPSAVIRYATFVRSGSLFSSIGSSWWSRAVSCCTFKLWYKHYPCLWFYAPI